MVAFVTGVGLGLERSSSSILGLLGQLGQASLGDGGDNVYVNVATGALIDQRTDEILTGVGLDMPVTDTYDNQSGYANQSGLNGSGWFSSFESSVSYTGTLDTAGSTITRIAPDGSSITYTYNGTDYVGSESNGANDQIVYNAATNTVTWTDESSLATDVYDLGHGGRLSESTDNNGNTWTYAYSSGGVLQSIANQDGESISFSESGGQTFVTTNWYDSGASGPLSSLTRVTYAYNASGELTSVTTALSSTQSTSSGGSAYTVNYGYDANGNLTSITQTDGSSLQIAYTLLSGVYKVTSLTQAVSSGVSRTTTISYASGSATISDPLTNDGSALGTTTTLSWDANGQLTQISSDSGAQVTSFAYASLNHVSQVTSPDGEVTTYGYDANGNRISDVDAAGDTITRTYDQNTNRLLTETQYQTPAQGSTAASTPETTWYAYDSHGNLAYTVSPLGEVTQYLYNSLGQLTSTVVYTAETYNVSGLSSTTPIAKASLDSWVAGISDKSTTQLTTNTYDFRGNLASTTSYGVTNANGAGNTTSPVGMTTTGYTYDQFGNLLSKTVGYNTTGGTATEYFVYDGLGRVIASTDFANETTTVAINYSGGKSVVTTLANGTTETSTYDLAGELTSYTTSGSGLVTATSNGSSLVATNVSSPTIIATTTYTYDADGRLMSTTDPTGLSTYYLYDDLGRKVADITDAGALTEYKYNADNELAATVQYNNKLTATQLASVVNASPTSPVQLSSVRPGNSSLNRWIWNIYDTAQRLVETINVAGAVTYYTYDGQSNLLTTTQFDTKLTTTQVGGFKTTLPTTVILPASSTSDRITTNFYDGDGRLVGVLNPDGYLTQNVYDDAGQKIETIAYANAPTVTTGTFAQIQASVTPSSSDIYNWYVYDTRGFLAATIDGAGDLTRYAYTPMGDVAQTITGEVLNTSGFAATPPTLASLPAVSTTTTLDETNYAYNAFGQVVSATKVLAGGVNEATNYLYDPETNLLLAETTAAGTSSARTTTYEYDALGRLVGEMSGVGSAALDQLINPIAAQITNLYDIYGTTYGYDADGRMISKTTPNGSATDATGNTTLYYYSIDGRLVYTVNALGDVAENDYDTFGDVTDAIVYGNAIAASTLSSMSGGMASLVSSTVSALADTNPGDATEESQTQSTYNDLGLLTQITDAVGSITTLAYTVFNQISTLTQTLTSTTSTETKDNSYTNTGQLSVLTIDDGSGDLNIQTKYYYDAFGRVTSISDPDHHITSYTYDNANRVVSETDGAGEVTTYAYDGRGNMILSTDAAGDQTTYSYDQFERNDTETIPGGYTTTTEKNAYGQTVAVTDANGNASSYAYDADGNLVSYTDGWGDLTTYTYDTNDRLLESNIHMAGPNQLVAYTYDALGRVLTTTVDPGGLNLVTTNEYDAKGNLAETIDPYGVITQYGYDLDGRMTSQVVDAATGGLGITTLYGYDLGGRLISVTQAAGTSAQRLTLNTYDNDGRLILTQVDPNGLDLTTAYVYDADGNVIARQDASGATTRFVYDGDNRVIYEVDGVGDVTKTTYPVYAAQGTAVVTERYVNQVSASTLASWAVTVSNGKPTATALTSSSITTNVSTSTSDEITTQLYDGAGRLTYVIDAAANVTQYTYDGVGNLIQTTVYATPITATTGYTISYVQGQISSLGLAGQSGNQTSRYVYDYANRLAYSIDADGDVTGYVYNQAGQVIKQTQYAGFYTTTGNNPSWNDMQTWLASTPSDQNDGWEGSVSGDPDNRVTRTFYDNAGRVEYSVDGAGYITAYYYYPHTVQKQQYEGQYTVTDGMETSDVTNLLTTDHSDSVVTTYTYDNDNRLISTSIDMGNGLNLQTVLTLDAMGDVVDSISAYGLPDAEDTHYTYDAAGRMITETKAYGDPEASTTVYTYDGMGRVTGVLSANEYSNYVALGSNPTAAEVANLIVANGVGYTYDAVGRLLTTTQAVNNNTNPATVAVTTNEYDAFGNLIKVTDPNGNAGYFYFNKLNQQTLQVDPDGYGTATTYAFGQVVQVDHYALAATGTWSETSKPTFTSSSGDEITAITRDNMNRVIGTTDATGATESFRYDAFGDQVQVTNQLGGTTYNTYDDRGLLIKQLLPITSTTNTGATEATSVTNTFAYDSRGNMTQKVEAQGLGEQRTFNYVYDKDNRLVSQSSDAIQVLSESDFETRTTVTPTINYIYDDNGNLIEEDDAEGNRTLYFYNHQNQKIAQLTADGSSSNPNATGELQTWSYDSYGNVISTRTYGDAVTMSSSPNNAGAAPPSPVNPNNYRETDYTYDRANRLISTTIDNVFTGRHDDSSGYITTTGNLTSTTVYDLDGNVIETTDAGGNATYYFYDAAGRQIAQVDPDNYLTYYVRNQDGNVTEEDQYATPVSGTVNTTSSPSAMRSAAIAAGNPNDRITTYTYDKDGRVLTQTRENVLAYKADDSSGLIPDAGTTSNPGTVSSTITYTYDAMGDVTSETQATGDETTYAYDDMGRKTLETDPVVYNPNGTTVQQEIQTYYDGLGEITRTETKQVGGGYQRTAINYWNYGRLIGTTDASGFTTDYFYDADGYVVSQQYNRTESSGSSVLEGINYTYDAKHDLTGQATGDWNGSNWVYNTGQTTYGYDVYGEQTAVYENGELEQSSAYDNAGRLWETNSGDGTWKLYGYNAAGQMTLELTSAGADLAGYSSLSAALTAIYGSQNPETDASVTNVAATTYKVDGKGQVVTTYEPFRQLAMGVTQSLTTSKAYDAFGDVVQSTDASGNTTTYAYNTLGDLTKTTLPEVTYVDQNGATHYNVNPVLTDFYDISGRQMGSEDADGDITYGKLVAGTGYNGSAAVMYKQIDPDGGIIYRDVDTYGDITEITDALGNDELKYYDADGRLVADEQPERTDGTNIQLETFYGYDGLGELIKETNSVMSSATVQANMQSGINFGYSVNWGSSPVLETTDYDAIGRVTKTMDYQAYYSTYINTDFNDTDQNYNGGPGQITNYTYAWNSGLQNTGMGLSGGWVKTTSISTGSMTDDLDYFGREIGHTDYSGDTYVYTYDHGGRMTLDQETSATGTQDSYEYFNTGLVGQETTIAQGIYEYSYGTVSNQTTISDVANYGYDANGNRTSETYTQTNPVSINIESITANYDALNRLTKWCDSETNTSSYYYYDLNSNIRQIDSKFTSPVNQTAQETDYWYTYDSMNRVVISDGALVSGVIQGYNAGTGYYGGTAMTYDADGNRKTATTYSISGEHTEYYGYSTDGYLMTVQAGDSSSFTGLAASQYTAVQYSRDALGRITADDEYQTGGIVYDRDDIVYNKDSEVIQDTTDTDVGSYWITSQNVYYYLAYSIDSSGNVSLRGGGSAEYGDGQLGLEVSNVSSPDGGPVSPYQTKTTYAYNYWDSPQQSEIRYDNSQGSNATTYSYFNYDTLQNLTYVHVNDGNPYDVKYTENAEGEILQREEMNTTYSPGQGPTNDYFYVNGQQLGEITNNGSNQPDFTVSISDQLNQPSNTSLWANANSTTQGGAQLSSDFDSNYEALNVSNPGSTISTYTVLAGDTLQSIAQKLWGDSSLWYLLANANGLSFNTTLQAGQVLQIPDKVTNFHLSSSTAEVYDPSKAVGDVMPTQLPPIPVQQPSHHSGGGCGIIGEILVAIVVIAVNFIPGVGQAVSGVLGSLGQAIGGATTAIGDAVGDTIGDAIGTAVGDTVGDAVGTAVGDTISTGLSDAITGGLDAGLTDVATQGVGLATGLQSQFSWSQLGLSIISGGVGADVGDVISQPGLGGAFVRGATTSAITQGLGVATGLQKSFSWQGVAIAGVTNLATTWASQQSWLLPQRTPGETEGQFATSGAGIENEIGAGLVGNAIGAGLQTALVKGSNFGTNFANGIPGVIGNTIGNVIAAEAADHQPVADQASANAAGSFGVNGPGAGFNLSLPADPFGVVAGFNASMQQLNASLQGTMDDLSASDWLDRTSASGLAAGGPLSATLPEFAAPADAVATGGAASDQAQAASPGDVVVTAQGPVALSPPPALPSVSQATLLSTAANGDTLSQLPDGEFLVTGHRLPWWEVDINQGLNFFGLSPLFHASSNSESDGAYGFANYYQPPPASPEVRRQQAAFANYNNQLDPIQQFINWLPQPSGLGSVPHSVDYTFATDPVSQAAQQESLMLAQPSLFTTTRPITNGEVLNAVVTPIALFAPALRGAMGATELTSAASSVDVLTGRAAGVLLGPEAAESSSAANVDSYVSGLYSKATPTSTPSGLFEVEQTGPLNYRVVGSNTTVDIDGYTGSAIDEAKFVGDSGSSPFVEGSDAPDFIRSKILTEQQSEFQRFQSVIADPNVPFNSLNVLTNQPAAVPYFQNLMDLYQIPGSVKVVPTTIPFK